MSLGLETGYMQGNQLEGRCAELRQLASRAASLHREDRSPAMGTDEPVDPEKTPHRPRHCRVEGHGRREVLGPDLDHLDIAKSEDRHRMAAEADLLAVAVEEHEAKLREGDGKRESRKPRPGAKVEDTRRTGRDRYPRGKAPLPGRRTGGRARLRR